MKFQLIAASAAFFAASVSALPAPQTVTDNHGLIPDTDDWAGETGGVEAHGRVIPAAAADFNFTTDFSFALDRLFAEIEKIPDEVLEKGDEALHEWLVAHGWRAGDAELPKRDTAGSGNAASILERGKIVARASAWKVSTCVAAIVQLLATTAVPAAKLLRIKKYIEALGGVKQAVQLLLGATTRAEKLKAGGEALVYLSAELLGISTVQKHCF